MESFTFELKSYFLARSSSVPSTLSRFETSLHTHEHTPSLVAFKMKHYSYVLGFCFDPTKLESINRKPMISCNELCTPESPGVLKDVPIIFNQVVLNLSSATFPVMLYHVQ